MSAKDFGIDAQESKGSLGNVMDVAIAKSNQEGTKVLEKWQVQPTVAPAQASIKL